jgi:FlaG/FlaF family flagellin (archaellin)
MSLDWKTILMIAIVIVIAALVGVMVAKAFKRY